MITSHLTSIAYQLESKGTRCIATAFIKESGENKLLIASNRYTKDSGKNLYEQFNYYLNYLVILFSIENALQTGGDQHAFLRASDKDKERLITLFSKIFSCLNPSWSREENSAAASFLTDIICTHEAVDSSDLVQCLASEDVIKEIGPLWVSLNGHYSDINVTKHFHVLQSAIDSQLKASVMILVDKVVGQYDHSTLEVRQVPTSREGWSQVEGEMATAHFTRKNRRETSYGPMKKFNNRNLGKASDANLIASIGLLASERPRDYNSDVHAELRLLEYCLYNKHGSRGGFLISISKTPCFACAATIETVFNLLRLSTQGLSSQDRNNNLIPYPSFAPSFLYNIMQAHNYQTPATQFSIQFNRFYPLFIDTCRSLSNRLVRVNNVEDYKEKLRRWVNNSSLMDFSTDQILFVFEQGVVNQLKGPLSPSKECYCSKISPLLLKGCKSHPAAEPI